MIRALGQHEDGRPVVFLGIDRENLERMIADQPIRINIGDLVKPAEGESDQTVPTGLPDVEVVIFWCPDMDALAKLMKK